MHDSSKGSYPSSRKWRKNQLAIYALCSQNKAYKYSQKSMILSLTMFLDKYMNIYTKLISIDPPQNVFSWCIYQILEMLIFFVYMFGQTYKL
jgi:hypothetical protein